MDRFQSFQVFVRVAETASFAAAARGLGMSPPAVTRAVSALEERLGTRLLVRTTRSVRLTDSGTRFLEDCRRILGDLQEAENSAIGLHATPSGELRITAPVLFGRHFVTPILGDFLDRFPQVSATTLFIDRVVNLMDEGLDVAIRIGDLPDSALSAIRVGSVRRVVFAAPDYLKRYGTPRHPDDLADHRVVQSLALDTAPEWRFQVERKPYAVRLAPRVRMNTNDAVIALAEQGWGLSCLLSYQVAPHLMARRLQTVLTAFEPPPLPVHILHQEGRQVSAKVRAFVDFMVERLRADPVIGAV